MVRVATLFCLLAVPLQARADHHDMEMGSGTAESHLQAGVSILAAHFDSTFYAGDYEGVVPAVAWWYGRTSVAVSMAMYSLEANGLRRSGVGDVMAMGQLRLVGGAERHAGIALGVTAPTGAERDGLGMGHVMVMPAVFGAWTAGRITYGTSFGYGRAWQELGHVHGMWPLVEPMNMSELTWSGSGRVELGHHVETAAHVSGAIPVGAEGVSRLIGGVGAAWSHDAVSTGLELQMGFVGDPFVVRAIAETAVRF